MSLDNDQRVDLARMYRMFSLVEEHECPGLLSIATAFRQYVSVRGNEVVDEHVKQLKAASEQGRTASEQLRMVSTFIQTLLELHDRLKGIVQECFSQDLLFQASLEEVFRIFADKDIGKHSFAARICDRIISFLRPKAEAG